MELDLWPIYDSLVKFTTYRQWKSLEQPLSKEDFYAKNRKMNYVALSGVDRYDKPTTIILTNPDSDIPNHKNKFMSLINSIDGKIILVSHRLLSSSILEYTKIENIAIEAHTYARFVTDMTKCPYVPKHEIMSKEELNEMLAFRYKKASDLPGIMQDDTQVIWIGANVGDVIKITRFSEVTGYSIVHRVVKEGSISAKKT